METISIKYIFHLKDDEEEIFDIQLSHETLDIVGNIPTNLPSWTDLEFHQCENCPLSVQDTPSCPLAANLVNLCNRFSHITSYDQISLEVITDNRTMTNQTTAQRCLSSLMGLIIATSGCPKTSFFKPMARFHLPFATTEETLFRATSTYLLIQYFLQIKGLQSDNGINGLRKIYEDVHTVNTTMAKRLKKASFKDASVNAIVLLDLFAKDFFYLDNESLLELEYIFNYYINANEMEKPTIS